MFQLKCYHTTLNRLKSSLKINPEQSIVANGLKSGTGTGSGSGSTQMDPEIWSNLPPELLEHLLSFLPLKTFLNLRSTCKDFRSLVFSPTFVSKHSSASPFSSFLLLSHPQCFTDTFPLYDTTLGAWRNLALPYSSLPASASASAYFNLLSSSNGLFCFSLPNSSSFIVCNLLAKSSRVIQFPSCPFTFELVTLVSKPDGYKIFMLCCKFSSSHAFVYDSKIQSWEKYEGCGPIQRENFHQEGAPLNGCLYFTTPEPFSVVGFDLEQGKWERLNAEMPRELTFVRLVSDGNEGKLYLVGGVGWNGISRSVRLWELSNQGNWEELERLPELMCRKFMCVCYHKYEHIYCFWHQGMICVCCQTWPEILYYKVSRRTWHWVSKCPSVPDKWSCGFKWFSFVPDLYTLA